MVRRFRGDGRGGIWHGEVATGREQTGPAPDGDYAFTVSVRDQRRQPRRGARRDPARPRSRGPGTGVSVRSFTLSGPLDVVPAGLAGDARGRAVRPHHRLRALALRRSGADPPRRAHRRALPRARSRATRGPASTWCACGRAATAPSGRWRWPACRSRSGRPAGRARWWCCRRSPGRASTRSTTTSTASPTRSRPGGPVGLDRPFRGGGLPPRFAAEVAPLLRYLDRERLAYDLTTDLSLARGEGPALGNAPGVAFAGQRAVAAGAAAAPPARRGGRRAAGGLLRRRRLPPHRAAAGRPAERSRRRRGG